VREERLLTRAQLAEKLAASGYPTLNEMRLTRIETGRTRGIDLDDMLALAFVLDCSPLHLLLPYGSGETFELPDGSRFPLYDEDVTVVPDAQPMSHLMLRPWLRGAEPLPGQNVARFASSAPPDELASLRTEARSIEHGKPVIPLAVAVRNEMDGEETAEPPALSPQLAEALEYARARTNAQVLAELGVDPNEFVEKLDEAEDDQMMENLRVQLVLKRAGLTLPPAT
jgi:hypothetical protein